MADQLRPYMAGSSAGEAKGEVQQDGAAGDAIDSNVPLLSVSDINPDMLEVGRNTACFCIGSNLFVHVTALGVTECV